MSNQEFGDDDLSQMTMAELKEKVRELKQIIANTGILDSTVKTATQMLTEQAADELVVTVQEPDVKMMQFFLDVRKAMDKKQKVRIIGSKSTGIVRSWTVQQ